MKNLLEHDDLFSTGPDEQIWTKYCGFLDLSLDEFMSIQRSLLMEHLSLLGNSHIGRDLMGRHIPSSLEEFRRVVPLTRYDRYERYFRDRDEAILPAPGPFTWTHTSGKSGSFKWAPHNTTQLARLADSTLAAFILAAAREKGEVRLRDGERIMLSLPQPPYVSGVMAAASSQRISIHPMPPLEDTEQEVFSERVRRGFIMALDGGVDFAASIAVVLAKLGEAFSRMNNGDGNRTSLLSLPPAAIWRLFRGIIKAKLARRPLLPRDIWRVKGLVCGGTDASIYRDQILHYWGMAPLDIYAATETGVMAMQAWDKTTMTFVPYSNMYEFIPEEEFMRSRSNPDYRPATLMMNEVQAGRTYELVVTNLNGGPFLRYRIGDLVSITALRNSSTGTDLPQMVFRGRGDEIIDLSGFARLDEKTIWKALEKAGVRYEDWSARKEYTEAGPVLRIYIEPSLNGISEGSVAMSIDEQLASLDKDYNYLRMITEADILSVTFLRKGSFDRYTRAKEAAGYDLAHLKPPHMNAPDATIDNLVLHSREIAV